MWNTTDWVLISASASIKRADHRQVTHGHCSTQEWKNRKRATQIVQEPSCGLQLRQVHLLSLFTLSTRLVFCTLGCKVKFRFMKWKVLWVRIVMSWGVYRGVAFGPGRMGLILKRKATKVDAVPPRVAEKATCQERWHRPGKEAHLPYGGRPGASKEKRDRKARRVWKTDWGLERGKKPSWELLQDMEWDGKWVIFNVKLTSVAVHEESATAPPAHLCVGACAHMCFEKHSIYLNHWDYTFFHQTFVFLNVMPSRTWTM